MEVSNRSSFLFYDPQAEKRSTEAIVKGAHWDADDTPQQKEENSRTLRGKLTISQGQGALSLRKRVTEAPSFSLSSESLRESMDINPELTTILRCKRIGHALNFKGEVPTPCGSTIDLEAFNETFTIPMLVASLLRFASTKNLKEQEKASFVASILKKALFNDNLDDAKIEKALEDLAKGEPFMIGSGWDWHSIEVILIPGENKDEYFLINCNRGNDNGSGGGIPGWNVYKMGKIDAPFIKNLASRMTHVQSEYLSAEKLLKEYGAKIIYSYPMKEQKVGNCTYTSLKTGISALMKIYEKSEGFKLKISEELFLKIEKGEKTDTYKSFVWADKRYVLEDFLIDLKQNKEAKHVEPIAKLIYEKLIDSPIMGFRIGWDLWLKTIELCKATYPPIQTLNPHLASLVRQFISEDAKSSSEKEVYIDRLTQLIFTFIDNGLNQKDLKNCVNFLLPFVQKGNGFKESAEVILKLFNVNEWSLGMSLLRPMMSTVLSFENELALYKSFLVNGVDKVTKRFPDSLKNGMQSFIENLVTLNKGEILNQLMLDQELEQALKPIILIAFDNLFDGEKQAKAEKLLRPYLSKEILESYDRETLYIKCINDDRIKEALELFKKMESDRKEYHGYSKITKACIKEKFWNEALELIRELKPSFLKSTLLKKLVESLAEEELSGEVIKITSEIKMLSNPHQHLF